MAVLVFVSCLVVGQGEDKLGVIHQARERLRVSSSDTCEKWRNLKVTMSKAREPRVEKVRISFRISL